MGENISSVNRSSPVQTITYATNWKSVACGLYHTAAVRTDGTLWTWGNNSDGQLMNNTITGPASPTQTILYGQNWKSISCGYGFTAAIKDGDF